MPACRIRWWCRCRWGGSAGWYTSCAWLSCARPPSFSPFFTRGLERRVWSWSVLKRFIIFSCCKKWPPSDAVTQVWIASPVWCTTTSSCNVSDNPMVWYTLIEGKQILLKTWQISSGWVNLCARNGRHSLNKRKLFYATGRAMTIAHDTRLHGPAQ